MKINKNITLEPLSKNYKKTYIYSSIEDTEVVLVFERNNAVRITGVLVLRPSSGILETRKHDFLKLDLFPSSLD
jgi:hypothetical protein